MSQHCTASEILLDIHQKSPILTYPTGIWHFCWGWPPFKFHHALWHQKTRVPKLLCGTVCVILSFFVFKQFFFPSFITHHYCTVVHNAILIQQFCLSSVHSFITCWSAKTPEHIINQSTLYSSLKNVVFELQSLWQNFNDVSPNGGTKYR